jgi:hypothetical protein
VHRGLNLKGRCQNFHCPGKKRIWVKLGYGTFDISRERFKKLCPSCGTPVKSETFNNIGFKYANLIITGMIIDNGEDV